MRILAFADIHGARTQVERLLEHEQHFDAVVIGGDLTTHGTDADRHASRTFRLAAGRLEETRP